jgi:hypothetical protein
MVEVELSLRRARFSVLYVLAQQTVITPDSIFNDGQLLEISP